MVEPLVSVFVNCPPNDVPCIAIACPDPDIPAQQAVGVAIAVINKMVDDTDNQKNVENKTASCSTRYT